MIGLANADAVDRRQQRQRAAAFATVLTAFVLEIVDSTIVNTALPAIRQSLGAGAPAMQWISAAYFLSLGSLLLIGGRLGDVFGYRRVFIAGVAAFVVASCLCGLARDAGQLVAARLLQGAAGAIMAPQVMAIIQLLYSPIERVGRLAWFGVIGGLAAILGPILGGLLIEADVMGLGWRMIFLINLPIGALSIATAWRFIPRVRSEAAIRIDGVGTALFLTGFALLLIARIEGPELGWPAWCFAALGGSGAVLAIGWRHARRRERRSGSAVIATALFALPTFGWGLVAITAFSAAAAGFLTVFAIALQQGAGLDALQTAWRHVPFGLGVMAGISLIGRRLLPRLGRRLLIAGAALMAAAGCAALAQIAHGLPSDTALAATLLVTGIGMGMLAGPLPPVIVSEVDRTQAGTASAMLKTAQQIGGAIGVAIIGALYLSAGDDAAARRAGLYPAGLVFAALLAVVVPAALRLPRDIFGTRAR